MAAESNRNGLKWTQHPLISTVLWALGTDAARNDKPEQVPTSSTLKWKDEGSGVNNSLNEYINHVQPSGDISTSANRMEEEEAVTLGPGASRRHGNERREYDYQDEMEAGGGGGGGPADYTPSPQWGFWVAITPPQPEMFPHTHRNSHSEAEPDH